MKDIYDINIVGVIGAGSFGTAVANLVAKNHKVLLYARREEVKDQILRSRKNANQEVHPNVTPGTDMEELAARCPLIFPTVPSSSLREMIRDLSPFLKPHHILIHATKGLDADPHPESPGWEEAKYSRKNVKTMSEVMLEESVVLRVGAMAGPNLAMELAGGKPAATVIASEYDEVIHIGRSVLRSERFQVYGNHDIIGVEFSGVLKNTIAIASGAVTGLDLGENARALLITKGLSEMIRLGSVLGSDTRAFFGLAGMGDLVATCNSRLSRNFTVGYRLAQGESLREILASTSEVAEGINTVKIAKKLGEHYGVRLPIIETLYDVLFGAIDPREGLVRLMQFPYGRDVDFL